MTVENLDSNEALLKKADQLRLGGFYDQSIKIYQQMIKQNPFLAPAKLGLGRVFFEIGDLVNSRTLLEEFAEFVPEHALSNKILAKIYMHFSQYAKAHAKIEMVLEITPNDTMARKMLVQIEELDSEENTLGNDDTKKIKSPTNTATIAEIYFNQGHHAEARDIYKDLSKTDPENVLFQNRLQEIEKKLSPPEPQIVKDPASFDAETVEIESETKTTPNFEISKPIHFIRHSENETASAIEVEVQSPFDDEPKEVSIAQLEASERALKFTRKDKLENLLRIVQQNRRG